MKKISFKNDYSEWACSNILDKLLKTNLEQEDWYGEDIYSKNARKLIKKSLEDKNVDIHFVSWWTQANLLCISSILKPYESVIAAKTWHIATHEAWAIESTGHKINTIDTNDWKLKKEDLKKILEEHTDEHMVKPKLVFISNSTEIWSIYTKKELKDLKEFCQENNLYLYLDWARLASALSSKYNDIKFWDLTKLLDIFYIWWTKNGALLWEAIVIVNDKLKEDFRYNMKQKWAMLAKWRILWIQFEELFQDNLYLKLWEHANNMAFKIAESIEKKWYNFLTKPESNQIFPILPNNLIKKLSKDFDFYVWQKIDEKNFAIRIVTSWATKKEDVERFIEFM